MFSDVRIDVCHVLPAFRERYVSGGLPSEVFLFAFLNFICQILLMLDIVFERCPIQGAYLFGGLPSDISSRFAIIRLALMIFLLYMYANCNLDKLCYFFLRGHNAPLSLEPRRLFFQRTVSKHSVFTALYGSLLKAVGQISVGSVWYCSDRNRS